MVMPRQNEFAEGYSQNIDLRNREDEIISQVQRDMAFEPEEVVGRSTWWGSERVGAFQCAGTFEGKPVILKIQGVEPSASEIDAIEAVNAAANNTAMRSPALYASQRWDSDKGFEALVVERISSDKLIGLPTSEAEVQDFFDLYANYSTKLRPVPWMEKPTGSFSDAVRKKVADQTKASQENYPNHPFRHSDDALLITSALEMVTRQYDKGVELFFQHCHITSDDVFLPNGDDPRHLYTSNFVWAWKPKFYDALIGYHHFPRLLIDRGKGVTKEMVAEQTDWWLKRIQALPKSEEERVQLQTLMLNLAMNRLTIDDLTLDPNNPLAPYLIETTRQNIHSLMDTLAR